MPKIVLFENANDTTGTTIDAKLGQSLMKAAVGANIEGVAADCGGTLTCATCHVMVREPWHSQQQPSSNFGLTWHLWLCL